MITIPLKEYLVLRTSRFGYRLFVLHAKVMMSLRRKQKRLSDAVKGLSEYPQKA